MSTRSAAWRLVLVVAVPGLAACARRAGSASPAAGNTVSADDIRQNPNVPVEQLLAGRIAGVNVARAADGGLLVTIRGTSYSPNTAPLYLVDGVPYTPGPNGSLTGINPADIQSIRVLKDPASLTMYGARGANGVIVIRMKAPGR